MNLRKLIVYKYDVMFDILNEIKEKFNFDIINADEQNIATLQKEFKTDFVIISKDEKDNIKNHLIIKDTPIKIDKFIELINLNFLKEKFSFQSDISVGPYKLDLNSRKISKNNKVMNLTEREINLIIFLKNSQTPVKIEKLQKEVWAYGAELETHTVETHIYRLRRKIKEKFDDENFIISLKHGYQII